MPKRSTRERLLEISARLFYERGYHATGVAAILRKAKVNSGSLYHFFRDKEALLTGVLEWYLGQLNPVLIAPVEASESDPVERVFALLAFYRRLLEDSGFTQGCPIGNLALEVSESSVAARSLVDRNFEGWTAAVKGWLVEARGRLPRGTDLEGLALFVLVTMEGGIMLARARRSIEPFDRAVAELRKHFDLLERSVQ